MKLEKIEFPDFNLWKVEAASIDEVPFADVQGYSRVEIPFHPNNNVEMEKRGYIFVDRTVGVEISFKKSKIDYQKMIRFKVRREDSDNDVIQQIALNSFPADRRFHVRPLPDSHVAESIIRRSLDELSEVYACIHKEQIVGFLGLKPYGEKDCFIYLAAVQERYRAAGAAVSLYAYAILSAKENGCERICGRISSANTSVMNLYAFLGAAFSNPLDVYVRNE